MIELEIFLKEFGQALKRARKAMGLSQVAASHQMQIDYRHYQNIEGGKINLRLDTLIKLINFYGLDKEQSGQPNPLHYLVGYAGETRGVLMESAWDQLYRKYAAADRVAFFSYNIRSRALSQVNSKLLNSLGFRHANELNGRSINHLLMPDSADLVLSMASQLESGGRPKSMCVTVRTCPPAVPVSMMAVIARRGDGSREDDFIHGILLEKKMIEANDEILQSILAQIEHTSGEALTLQPGFLPRFQS